MSMIGNYRRISESELQELTARPEELSSFLDPEDRRNDESYLHIDKTWHIIHFLLNGEAWTGGWPLMGVVLGGTQISEEDVGYGPARYLTAKEVQDIAAALNTIPPDELWSRFRIDAVREARIYPEGWNSEDRDYVVGYYSQLRDFFAKAARSGECMVVYLN